MEAAPLWRVDASGNVRPYRPGSGVQPQPPVPSAPPRLASARPPAPPLTVLASYRRPLPVAALALPAGYDDARHQRYQYAHAPIDVSASLTFASPAASTSFDCYSFDGRGMAPAEISMPSAGVAAATDAMTAARSARRPRQHASVRKQPTKREEAPPRRAAAASSSAASSTERGRRFRQRLQARELQARADIELLRQQIVRIQSLQRSGEHQALVAHHRDLLRSLGSSPGASFSPPLVRAETRLHASADGESALRFVREYFALFRYGVLSPAANPSGPTAGVALDTSRHEAFLAQCAAPDVKFDEFVGVGPMVDQWRRYTSVHSFIKLDPVSMEVQVVGGRATVVAKGVLHIRYSRRTLESVFPRLLGEQPALAARLVGRLVHMHYTSHYFFDERGRLASQQIVPDFVSALKDVLGSLDDVAAVLDCALLKEHVLGEIDYERFEEEPAAVGGGEDEGADGRGAEQQTAAAAATTSGGMDIDFILS